MRRFRIPGFWESLRRILRRSKDAKFARFIFSQNDFNAAKQTIRPRVFMPQPDGALSVFCIDRIQETKAWEIGKNLATERSQNLHARADVMREAVTQQGLRIVHDEPPPRHRNIVGWPPTAQKEDQKLIALELANAAALRLP